MKGIVTALGILCLMATRSDAAAGVVVLEDTPVCDFYIVETNNGYALLEWYGGVVTIWEGDEAYGEFESYGFTDVHIKSRGDMRVWVEDYWVDEADAADYFYSNC